MHESFIDNARGMAFYGNPNVLTTLKDQAKNPNENINIVIVMPGGGMKGVLITGPAEAIHRRNLTQGINVIVGTSAGALVGSRLIDGNKRALDVFHHRNPKKRLIQPGRLNPYFDITTFIRMIRQDYPLNVEAFKNNRTRLLVNVFNVKRGAEQLVDAGSLKDPDSAVLASALFPAVTGLPHKTMRVRGEPCADGWTESPFLIQQAIDQNPTHLWFLLTNPIDYRVWVPKGLTSVTRRLSDRRILPKIWHSVASYPERFNQQAETVDALATGQLQIPGVEVAFTAPTETMSTFLMNERQLWKKQDNSRAFANDLLFTA